MSDNRFHGDAIPSWKLSYFFIQLLVQHKRLAVECYGIHLGLAGPVLAGIASDQSNCRETCRNDRDRDLRLILPQTSDASQRDRALNPRLITVMTISGFCFSTLNSSELKSVSPVT